MVGGKWDGGGGIGWVRLGLGDVGGWGVGLGEKMVRVRWWWG